MYKVLKKTIIVLVTVFMMMTSLHWEGIRYVAEDNGDNGIELIDDTDSEIIEVDDSGDTPSGDETIVIVDDPENNEVTEPVQNDPVVTPVEPGDNTDVVENNPTPVDDPVVEPTVNMPAVNLSGAVGSVLVRVSAPEGALPEGVEMALKQVKGPEIEELINESVDGTVAKYTAVDITFVHEGKEVEPKKAISVQMDVFGAVNDNEKTVLHIDDDKNVEVMTEAETKNEKASTQATFETKDFSVYVVVETVVPRLTVKFMNGTTEIASMIIKAADTAEEVETIIYDPGTGSIPAGQVFKGWTTDPNYTSKTELLTIADIRSAAMTTAAGLSADDSVTYYAALFKQYTVTYVDGKGITVGSEVKEIPSRETEASYTVNMGFSTDDSHNFEGWQVADGSGNIIGYPDNAETETVSGQEIKYYPNGKELTITGNVKFSVNAPEGHWLIFDENGKGATYNAPRFIKAGEVTSAEGLLEMVRNGYTFKGWFTGAPSQTGEEPTGSEFEFGHALSETTTIYAKWEAITSAQYTVLIWKQNVAGGDNYDFVEAVHPTGTVGTTPDAVNSSSGSVAGAEYTGETGFHFKSTDQASKTITPEGNTVVNVYWDRNEYTLTFQVYDYVYTVSTNDNDNNPAKYGDVNGQKARVYWNYGAFRTTNSWNGPVYNGTVYTRSYNQSWQTIKSITALYGQNIRNNFPIVGSNGVTYTGASWSSQNSSIFDDDAYVSYIDTMQAESTTFRLAYNPTSNYYTYHVKYYVEALPEDTNRVTFNGKEFVLYYDAVIHFQSADLYSTESEEFTDITGFTKYGSNPQYSDGQANFDDDWTISLYYTRNHYKINYMDGAYVDGNGNPIEEAGQGQLREIGNILYGADLTSYNKGGNDFYTPTAPAGYVFEGWYIDSACTHAYDFTTMPEGGLTVYAKWRQIQYRVFLHPNAGTDSTLTWGSESQDMNFRVSYGGKVSVPTGQRTGYEFYGWYTDEACTKAFAAATVLNDSTVTTEYDKTTHMTDPMDKWGNGATSNADVNRFWITKEFNLYAKWSAVTVGADGIGIIYDPNGGDNAPSDTALYKDNTSATAGAASTAPSGKVFDHWVVQTWNGTSYVDTETTVLPGQTFTVLKSNAKITDAVSGEVVAPANVVSSGKYKYTVQLRAEYKDEEVETPTHIDWYSNYGSENDGKGTLYHSNTGIKINEAVDILSAPTRAGYTFKGWTKTKGGTTADFLAWDGSQYTATVNGETIVATKVAADEKQPYEDLFAVWEEKEVTINYAVASDSTDMGTVSPTSETVKVDTGTATGSTATAASNTYVFDYWTVDSGTESISTDVHYTPSKTNGLYESHTYYAHFRINEAPVTVHHYLKGTTTKVAEDVTSQEVIGTEYTAAPVTTYQEKDLTVDSYNPSRTITVSAEENTIIIYYTLPLVINAATVSKEYDGQTLTGYFTYNENDVLTSDKVAIESAFGDPLTIGPASTAATSYQAATNGIPGYYAITNNSGTLEITKSTKELFVESVSKDWDYDADTHTYKVYKVTYGTDTITGTEGQTTFTLSTGDTVTVTPTGKGAAGVKNVSDSGDNSFTWTVTNSDSYTKGEDKVGKLTINQVDLSISMADRTLPYNGTTQYGWTRTDEGKETVTGLVNNETVTIDYTPSSGKTVGTYENGAYDTDTLVIKDGEEDVTENYNVTSVTAGKLTIEKDDKTLSVESVSKDWDYDADTHTYKVYKVTYGTDTITGTEGQTTFTLSTGDTVTVTPTGKGAAGVKNVSDSGDNSFTWTVTNSDSYTKGEDKVGKLTINPKAVTITAVSDSKEYDGKPLTNNGYTNTDLAKGDSIDSVTVTGSQTKVGKSANTPSGAIIVNVDGDDVTNNYEITYRNGELEVVKSTKELSVESGTQNWTYDGTEHTEPVYTVKYGTETGTATLNKETGKYELKLNTGDVVAITPAETAKVTHVAEGEVANAFTWTVRNEDFYTKGTDKVGKLSIDPATLTIVTEGATKEYDGTALTADGSIEGFVNNETATFTVTGSQTKVGKSNNTYSLVWDGTAVESDYELDETIGELEVVKSTKELSVESGTQNWTYDGTEHTEPVYTVKYGTETGTATLNKETGKYELKLNTGDVVAITPAETAKVTHVAEGEVANAFTWTVRNEDFYTKGTDKVGKLSIDPATLTIVTEGATKEYDGTALTADGSIEGFVNNETATFTVTGSQTKVGKSNNTYSLVWDGTAVESDYELDETIGELEVTESTKALVISSSTKSWTYDGQNHKDEVYTVTYDGKEVEADATGKVFTLPTGDTVTITATAEGVKYVADTKEENNTYTYVLTNEDQFSNVSSTFGTLSITKKPVSITAASDSKKYDGKPLTNGNYTNTDLAQGDEIKSVAVEGAQIQVGSSDNVPSSAVIKNGETDVTANYAITYVNGTLTVTRQDAEVVLTAASDTKIYDGTPLTNAGVTATGLPEGHTVEATASGSQTTAGTGLNVVNDGYVIKDAEGKDVTSMFSNVVKVDGKLTVTPKEITITADSDKKVYDGTALTKDSYTNTDLAEGDKIDSVTVTGSQTIVGKSENVPSEAKIVNAAGEDVTSSYTIKYVNGELEVTPKELTITANSDEKVYDGKALTNDGYTASELGEGDKVDSVKVEGSQTVVGTSDNVASEAKIVNAEGEDVTASYTITYVKGELEVTPKELTITANSDEKVYDGKALTNDGYTASELGEGDKVDSVKVEGSQTVVGTSDNVASEAKIVNAEGEDVTVSYTITYVNGKLEVTKREITVTVDGNSDEVVFDREEHTVEGYELSSEDELFDEEAVVFEGEASVSGTEPGEYPMGLTEDMFSYDDDNFTVTFVINDGGLKITAPESLGYKVEHYQQNLDDEGFTLFETEELSASFREEVTAEPKDYEGFTFDETVEGTVLKGVVEIDGELVLKVYYTRDTYEIRYVLNGGNYDGNTEDVVEFHKYGEVITIKDAPVREGYRFDYWQGSKHYPGDQYTVEGDHVFTAQWIKTDVPETSDASNMKLWVTMFALATTNSLGLAYVSMKRKKEEEDLA